MFIDLHIRGRRKLYHFLTSIAFIVRTTLLFFIKISCIKIHTYTHVYMYIYINITTVKVQTRNYVQSISSVLAKRRGGQ